MPMIPLFPLGTVLFPGAPLPLHIFEPRYRLMINECIDREEPFGAVLIRTGVEVGGDAEPHEVGTSARITRVERLPDGRMNIHAVGVRRFRLRSLDRSRPFLQGDVEYVDRDGEPQAETEAAANAVRELYTTQFRLALALTGQWTGRVAVPQRAALLADFVAGRIEAEAPTKQQLLETTTVLGCLEIERTLLERAVAALKSRVMAAQRERFSSFGAMN